MSSHLVRWATVMAVLVGTGTNSVAGGGPFTRGCAARDMQIMMMLEQRESANGIATQELKETLNAIFSARMVCSEGRVLDALEIYENVAQRITSDRMLSGRAN
jgi:hypothetical protein